MGSGQIHTSKFSKLSLIEIKYDLKFSKDFVDLKIKFFIILFENKDILLFINTKQKYIRFIFSYSFYLVVIIRSN
ncbi:hypothetical protein LEP1GSC013_0171 [Leptospira interrogans serovar Valbuzzi str. Duyster]|nr:hypothetical protein LEP1GSC013_0171 [Leptospira interrogans serovar Valbuzzi str. Duyster]